MLLFFLMVICFLSFCRCLYLLFFFKLNLKTEIQETPKFRHVFKVFLLTSKNEEIYLFIFI